MYAQTNKQAHILGLSLTLLEVQSRIGDKPLYFQVFFPHNETAALKGLIGLSLHRGPRWFFRRSIFSRRGRLRFPIPNKGGVFFKRCWSRAFRPKTYCYYLHFDFSILSAVEKSAAEKRSHPCANSNVPCGIPNMLMGFRRC